MSKSGNETKTVAVKVLNSLDDIDRERLMREASLLLALEHPHIVEIIGIVPANMLMVVLEYMADGALDGLLRIRELNSMELLGFSIQIADALSFLERRMCIHRDIAA